MYDDDEPAVLQAQAAPSINKSATETQTGICPKKKECKFSAATRAQRTSHVPFVTFPHMWLSQIDKVNSKHPPNAR